MACERNHEAMKRDSEQWRALSFVGVQHVPQLGDEPAEEYEMRNCSCGSTLAKKTR